MVTGVHVREHFALSVYGRIALREVCGAEGEESDGRLPVLYFAIH